MFDYIWSRIRGKGDFKTYDYEKLSNELLHYGFFKTDFLKMSTEEKIKWAEECRPNISVHAFDAMYRKFHTYTCKNNQDIFLVYVVKDH